MLKNQELPDEMMQSASGGGQKTVEEAWIMSEQVENPFPSFFHEQSALWEAKKQEEHLCYAVSLGEWWGGSMCYAFVSPDAGLVLQRMDHVSIRFTGSYYEIQGKLP